MILTLASKETSLITINSKSEYVWAKIDPIAFAIYFSLLYDGIISETFGMKSNILYYSNIFCVSIDSV